MQTTSQLLMIRPVNFTFNEETAVNNAFQVPGEQSDVQNKAAKEFDSFVQVLRNAGVNVIVVNDTPEPHTPDSIFPNNWISFHNDGTVFLYPMFATNRRKERKPGVLKRIEQQFSVSQIIDFSDYEAENKFLEGTGSMVLDRENRITYACISPRTDVDVIDKWCHTSGYHCVIFHAYDSNGGLIYHTNVMMCVADRYVVICLDAIKNEEEQTAVMAAIQESGKELFPISMEQMNHFAGNMLQVNNNEGETLLIMSTQAYNSLTPAQIEKLNNWNPVIHSSLETIETNGGGSARCMMAEIHLPFRTEQY